MRKNIILLILLVAMTGLTGCIVSHTTGETEVGVRTVKFALTGKMGVEDKVYQPGSTYFFLAFINDWHTYDTKLQNLEMTIQKGRGDRAERDDLLFKTIDGNDISLDVIIAYRIDPKKAPEILKTVASDNETLRDKLIRTVARARTRDIFGELKTEEFYVAGKRETQSQRAKDELQKMFAPMGVIVEKVLTKDYRFNPEYQKAIEAKKVADQRVEKNKSAQHAALEEYKRKLEEAKGVVNKMVANADGEYQKTRIKADAYYEKQKLIAKAITAEGIAEAKGIQEMNKALGSAGGEAFVKLRIAEALQGKKFVLIPVSDGGMNLKYTDVNKLINTLGVQSLKGR